MPPKDTNTGDISGQNVKRLRRDRGQILIEYVLLLILVVTLATLITKLVVSRAPGEEGFIIKSWQRMLEAIGNDIMDK